MLGVRPREGGVKASLVKTSLPPGSPFLTKNSYDERFSFLYSTVCNGWFSIKGWNKNATL